MSKGTPLKVAICVPSFRGSIMTQTAAALINTIWTMSELGISMVFTNVDSSEIVTVRNMMASSILEKDDITHLLFVDDDMEFDPDTIIAMLRADRDVIGAVCPLRKLNLEAFHEAAKKGMTVEQCRAAATEFVVRHYADKVEVKEGVFRIRGIGMAVTLIKRRALLTMIEKGAVERRERSESLGPDALGNKVVYGFFDPQKDENSDSLLSEDYSFCQRWRNACGGEVWAIADGKIGHIGPYNFQGAYLERLHIGMV
jgi:hypothetical protein